MKKVLSIVLLLSLVLMLAACSGDPAQKFVDAIAATKPAKVTITTSSASEMGTLSGTFTLTYDASGAAVVEYSYEQWTLIGEGTEPKKTVTGTITRNSDGTYGDGQGFTGTADEIIPGFILDITAVKESAAVNESGTKLTAKVSADDTKAVLGVEFDVDVNLEITIADGKVTDIDVSYTTKEGNNGKITCKYE